MKNIEKITNIMYKINHLLSSPFARDLTLEECEEIDNMDGKPCIAGRLFKTYFNDNSHTDYTITATVFCEGLEEKDILFYYLVYAGEKLVLEVEEQNEQFFVKYLDEKEDDWQKDISELSLHC